MKFLIDAQLPFVLKAWIRERGFDTLHAADLPNGALTSDHELAGISEQDGRILISKDSDFLKLKVLSNKPPRLLLITTGNIKNTGLLAIVELISVRYANSLIRSKS